MRSSALRFSVPDRDPHLFQQLTAKILCSSVYPRILFRGVPPAQQEHGKPVPRSATRPKHQQCDITFVPSGENDAPWSSTSTSAQSTSPFCLNPSCYPAALTTRHCGDLRYSSLQLEHTARQRNKRERERERGHRHRFGCMPDHFAPAFDREKVHPSGARTSASLRLYSSARALPPRIASRDAIHDASLHLVGLGLLHRRQPRLDTNACIMSTLRHVASNAGHWSSRKRCVAGICGLLREMSRDVAEYGFDWATIVPDIELLTTTWPAHCVWVICASHPRKTGQSPQIDLHIAALSQPPLGRGLFQA